MAAIDYSIYTTEPAIFSYSALVEMLWQPHLDATLERRCPRTQMLQDDYHHVEYLSAPRSFIVPADQNAIASQVVGIHPRCLGSHVYDDRNLIELLTGADSGHAVYYLNREQQDGSELAASSRLVDANALEGQSFICDTGGYLLTIFHTPTGLMVFIIEEQDVRYVIERSPVVELI